ncbi:hypothetical protein PHMEG_00032202 [Phytophthora megakarya]|uniref:Uncharacterized protein n=1 Tax=Phytophthora megakarya TaxID=4795 RepID=A0A225UV67_9STRA|nr:hypothetical protein PHMEG_00032202 [Phytophthora megakarya]
MSSAHEGPSSETKRDFLCVRLGCTRDQHVRRECYRCWMCLASETSRTQRAKMLMSGGKTSKAAQHLNKAHGIGSDKTASEVG